MRLLAACRQNRKREFLREYGHGFRVFGRLHKFVCCGFRIKNISLMGMTHLVMLENVRLCSIIRLQQSIHNGLSTTTSNFSVILTFRGPGFESAKQSIIRSNQIPIEFLCTWVLYLVTAGVAHCL